jgi:hypothetical protein
METEPFTSATSPSAPVAIGFFGLGTGYFIWGADRNGIEAALRPAGFGPMRGAPDAALRITSERE